jgi:hypothetical protein
LGPCPWFLFHARFWVLCYGVWQGFNMNTNHRTLQIYKQLWLMIDK